LSNQPANMDPDRNVFMAKLAEQAERYDEMVEYMKNVVQAKDALALEERNLLSVAYKNVVGARRSSLRVVGSILQKHEEKQDSSRVLAIKNYKEKVEKELEEICNDILTLLDGRLIKEVGSDIESTVFYKKMKADYYRYLAEFKDGEDKATIANNAAETYKAATETASSGLAPTHPIRLGLALNYSVRGTIPRCAQRACAHAVLSCAHRFSCTRFRAKASRRVSSLRQRSTTRSRSWIRWTKKATRILR